MKKQKEKPADAPAEDHLRKLTEAYPGLEPGAKLLYVAGEDGSFYMIPESELKRCHRVAASDPNREILEASLAMGVVHSISPSGREQAIGTTVSFACCTTGTTGFTTLRGGWTHFVNLGQGLPAQAAPPAAPPEKGAPDDDPAAAAAAKTKRKPKA